MRLIVKRGAMRDFKQISFNSRLVRLIGNLNSMLETAEPSFQFQIGAIDRCIPESGKSIISEFQFQIGAIDRK